MTSQSRTANGRKSPANGQRGPPTTLAALDTETIDEAPYAVALQPRKVTILTILPHGHEESDRMSVRVARSLLNV